MNTLLGTTAATLTVIVALAGMVQANDGQTVPKPQFQLGDSPSQPLAQGSAEVQGFLDFFNTTYLHDGPPISMLEKDHVVWFPPQVAGNTSLELIARFGNDVDPDVREQMLNCLPGDPSYPPSSYPIYCEEGFSTGQFCQACHDSALYVEGGGLPEMMYESVPDFTDQHKVWLANWSQYGDWNATIMRLATRDPIWQAQIETETQQHPYADPAVIQDLCFSCHGEMGERQIKMDFGADQKFCTDMFYATVPGILGDSAGGKPYVPTGDCGAPINGMSVGDHPEIYAKYGSLARDGVSCETCHRIGDEADGGQWDGTDVAVFYGEENKYNVANRQTENPVPLTHEFTANFMVDMANIMAPDLTEDLDLAPMANDDNLVLTTATDTQRDVSYMRQSVLCGACHVLIVPEIPASYRPGGPLPDTPYYRKPPACTSDTFAPATNGEYGNPVTDDCVALGYEQATYLEWINSDFASEGDNGNTCQGCHMPLVTDPDDRSDHTAIMAQSTPGLSPKVYRRHRLMGINLPVSEMFMQFPDVLGVTPFSANVPDYAPLPNGQDVAAIQNYLLNGQAAIVDQATSQANGNGLSPDGQTAMPSAAVSLEVTSSAINGDTLKAEVLVTNNAGHKFPSGAGFRRGFLRFEVLDSTGQVIWVSGQTNPYGGICDGPCQDLGGGAWNLLASETPGGDPLKIQPHHQVITRQDQVQIYEIQEVDDTGVLTSRTLSLFQKAKDNRLLPRGFRLADGLGCGDDPNAGTEIFGIKQCSAAYATQPRLNLLTEIEDKVTDPYYATPELTGSDAILYEIPLADLTGTPAQVRVTMEYQTIPPGFLAARFTDGYDQASGQHLQATERSVYLTSHLNTNLDLVSTHPDNPDLTFSQNWTLSIYQTTADLGGE